MNRGDFVELAVLVLFSFINVGVVVLVMGALQTAGFGAAFTLSASIVLGIGLSILGALAISAWRDEP